MQFAGGQAGRPTARNVTGLLDLAALVSGLTLVAQTARRVSAAAALVAGLTFIAQLARRLIRERRARSTQREQAVSRSSAALASSRGLLLPPVI
jgi:hypothetical protein